MYLCFLKRSGLAAVRIFIIRMKYYETNMTYDTQDYIELTPEGLTQGTTLTDVFLLIMRESEGSRHLPLILDKQGFQLICQALENQHFPETKLMGKLARVFAITPRRVVVRYTQAGHFFATIFWQQAGSNDEHILNTELAQGIATSLEQGCPIVVYREEFNRLHNRQSKEGQVAIPLTAMSGDLLKEALRLAVESDNFELASQLRDEINSRQKDTGNP